MPRRYVEEPIDQGIALHLGGEDFMDLPVFNPPEIETEAEPKTTAKTKTEAHPKQAQAAPPVETKPTTAAVAATPSVKANLKETPAIDAAAASNAANSTQPSPVETPAIEVAATSNAANSTMPSPVETPVIEVAATITSVKQNPTETQDTAVMPHISEILPAVIPAAKQNPIIRQDKASQEIATQDRENPARETAAITFTQPRPKENAGENTANLVEISPATSKNAIETPRAQIEQIEHTLTQTVTALVEDKMQQLAQLIEDKLQGLTQAALFTAENTPPKQVAPHQRHAIPAQNAQTPDTQAPNTQTPVKTVATPSKKQATHPSTTSSTALSTPLDLGSLNYPEQLDAQQCEALHTLLHQCGDQAQNVLNLLAQRFENTHQPIKQPVAYFATLVERLQINKLDLSAAYHYKIKNTADINHQKQIDALQVKYQGQCCDYRHFAKVVEREITQTGRSFAEASEATNMTLILDDLSEKIKQTEANCVRSTDGMKRI